MLQRLPIVKKIAKKAKASSGREFGSRGCLPAILELTASAASIRLAYLCCYYHPAPYTLQSPSSALNLAANSPYPT